MTYNIARSILFSRFESKLPKERTQEHLEELIELYESPAGIISITAQEKMDLYNELYSEFFRDIINNKNEIEVKEGVTLSDPKGHLEWDITKIKSYYWNHLLHYSSRQLLKQHGDKKASEIIHSLDKETNTIIKHLEDPRRDEFTTKGLVIGYVQSGKTQNFTGLISKCADAGYRFIIVMAGMYNSLRLQTQIRIDKELTGYNTLNLDEEFVMWDEKSIRWEPLTSAGTKMDTKSGDFGTINKSFNDIFNQNGSPVIAVIKKNKSRLNKLYSWINDGKLEILDKIPLVLIDDEADQASIDTAKDEETDPTAINQGIRSILKKFKRHAYIGYTATPFANILIGRDKVNPEFESDLYPRNFIHTLPEPDGYFGSYVLFAEGVAV